MLNSDKQHVLCVTISLKFNSEITTIRHWSAIFMIQTCLITSCFGSMAKSDLKFSSGHLDAILSKKKHYNINCVKYYITEIENIISRK
jgi:hypothetical protein